MEYFSSAQQTNIRAEPESFADACYSLSIAAQSGVADAKKWCS